MISPSTVELILLSKVYETRADDGRSFVQFRALDDVSVSFAAGELHAVLGENGAGKSTLMHVLSGLMPPTEGTVRVDGKPVRFTSAGKAISAGISMVHQRPRLVDSLTILDNAILGGSSLIARRTRAAAKLRALMVEWGIDCDLEARCGSLSPSDRLKAALLAALITDPSFVILDEPTAALDPEERERFMEAVSRVAREGSRKTGVILVTHKLDDAVRWADRVSILRKGRLIDSRALHSIPGGRDAALSWLTATLAPDAHASNLSSREFGATPDAATDAPREGPSHEAAGTQLIVSALAARGDRARDVENCSFTAKPGEILGIFAYPGEGIETLEDALTGMGRATYGTISLKGSDALHEVEAARLTPRWLRSRGVAIVPSNRSLRGSNPAITCEDALISRVSASPFPAKAARRAAAQAILDAEGIPALPERLAGSLSGGQLQRLILARELGALHSMGARQPGVIILAECEWGLDLASVAALRARLLAAAAEGLAVIVLTDTPETMAAEGFYSRTLLLKDGRIS